jgi:hypothetical protein
MRTPLRLLLALGLLAVLALAAPAASAAPPQQVTPFVFFIYDESQNLVGVTVTAETFRGDSGVSTGTWRTYSPTGEVLATGRLTARHSDTGLVASVTQQSPVHGHGTLTVNSLTGQGSLDYGVEGGASGTVDFTTEPVPNMPNFFNVQLLGPVPPVLFTRGD